MDDKSVKRAKLESAIMLYGYQPTTAEIIDAGIEPKDIALLMQAHERMCNRDNH